MLSPKPKSKASRFRADGRVVKPQRPAIMATKAHPKPKDKKKRAYADRELNIPILNMITPMGIQKPGGKKKGKAFVDDAESMRTILAMVSADREGRIESKMQKARHMEEIREARRAEVETKEQDKKRKLEEVKAGLRRKRNGKNRVVGEQVRSEDTAQQKKGSWKKVSFGLDRGQSEHVLEMRE